MSNDVCFQSVAWDPALKRREIPSKLLFSSSGPEEKTIKYLLREELLQAGKILQDAEDH
jgi:hypothetical protein